MAYNPIEFSTISAVGTNSYSLTAPSGSLWNGINFVGAGEQNNFAYIGCNLQTDEAGTLTFQFSQDGTNWSSYPTTAFTVAAGINEVHTAWKGGRYVRPLYSGSDGSKTYFRLQTYYSNHPLPLSAPLNQSIGSDQDATVVRAVITGQDPDGVFSNQKQIGYGFSTTTTLSGSEVYRSGWIDISGYQQVQTNIVSDVDGTMTFEFSEDSAGSDIHRTLNISYLASNGFQLLSAPCFTKYVRYSYTNGTTPQSNFLYDTKLLTSGLSGQVLPLNGSVAGSMVANLGRNVIVGQNLAGNYVNSKVNEQGDLKASITNPTTAFGEIKVASNLPKIQLSYPYNINSLLVTTGSNGTATITQANQFAVVSTGATAGSSGSLRSNRTVKYRTGEGVNVRFTSIFTTGSSTGTRQLIGVGDASDGFFVGMSGSSFGFFHRQQGIETFISQSSFSIDRFDGSLGTSNPSGMNIRPEKGNVFDIKYQWLGFGGIKFAIENQTTGDFSNAHVIQYANNNILPSADNPTFNLRMETHNGANAEDVTIKSVSMAAFIEGESKITGPTQSTGSLVAKASGEDYLLFGLEGVQTFPSGGAATNKVNSYLRTLSVGNEGANNTIVSLKLVEDGTYSGQTYKYIGANSSVIRGFSGSYTPGTGKVLNKWFIPRGTSVNVDLTSFEYEIQPGSTIGVFLGGDASTNTDVTVSWVEDF